MFSFQYVKKEHQFIYAHKNSDPKLELNAKTIKLGLKIGQFMIFRNDFGRQRGRTFASSWKFQI